MQAQYRQVWELRANLEEQTEFYEHPSSPEPELNPGSVNFAIPRSDFVNCPRSVSELRHARRSGDAPDRSDDVVRLELQLGGAARRRRRRQFVHDTGLAGEECDATDQRTLEAAIL